MSSFVSSGRQHCVNTTLPRMTSIKRLAPPSAVRPVSESIRVRSKQHEAMEAAVAMVACCCWNRAFRFFDVSLIRRCVGTTRCIDYITNPFLNPPPPPPHPPSRGGEKTRRIGRLQDADGRGVRLLEAIHFVTGMIELTS